jgi:two-component system phosphate regulon sensor histidine kinase PhoR
MLQLQAQQEAVLNSMIEGLLVLDAHGRIQVTNQAFNRLFNIGEDTRGKSLIEVLRLHEIADLVQQVSSDGQTVERELRLPGPEERWLQVNAVGIAKTGDHQTGAVLVFHDLTRVKKLERAREEFVANVSHELRTPLSHIKGYAETLMGGAKDNPDVATKFLESIDRNAERLRLLIEDLLTISELESGRVRLTFQSVNLRSVVDKVFDDFGSRAKVRGVKLLNEIPELNVCVDPSRLEQLFSNLVDNAIKYGGDDGSVLVGVRSVNEGQIEVFVRDDGPGIPAEALERVFERFYRVDKARSRQEGGTGLGLSIVKHIVLSHGGKIWAESKPGAGATFIFTLRQEESPPAMK